MTFLYDKESAALETIIPFRQNYYWRVCSTQLIDRYSNDGYKIFLESEGRIAVNFRWIHTYVKTIEDVGRVRFPVENIGGESAAITSRAIIPVRSNERVSKKEEQRYKRAPNNGRLNIE